MLLYVYVLFIKTERDKLEELMNTSHDPELIQEKLGHYYFEYLKAGPSLTYTCSNYVYQSFCHYLAEFDFFYRDMTLNILDVGCGMGTLGLWLKSDQHLFNYLCKENSLKLNVIGIDLEATIKIAKQFRDTTYNESIGNDFNDTIHGPYDVLFSGNIGDKNNIDKLIELTTDKRGFDFILSSNCLLREPIQGNPGLRSFENIIKLCNDDGVILIGNPYHNCSGNISHAYHILLQNNSVFNDNNIHLYRKEIYEFDDGKPQEYDPFLWDKSPTIVHVYHKTDIENLPYPIQKYRDKNNYYKFKKEYYKYGMLYMNDDMWETQHKAQRESWNFWFYENQEFGRNMSDEDYNNFINDSRIHKLKDIDEFNPKSEHELRDWHNISYETKTEYQPECIYKQNAGDIHTLNAIKSWIDSNDMIINDGMSILDIGCGFGSFGADLKSYLLNDKKYKNIKLYGVDISDEAIKIMHQLGNQQFYDKIFIGNIIDDSVINECKIDNGYDIILSNHILYSNTNELPGTETASDVLKLLKNDNNCYFVVSSNMLSSNFQTKYAYDMCLKDSFLNNKIYGKKLRGIQIIPNF